MTRRLRTDSEPLNGPSAMPKTPDLPTGTRATTAPPPEGEPGRRSILQMSLAATVLRAGAWLPLGACSASIGWPDLLPQRARPASQLLGFSSVPVSSADALSVPPGYRAQTIAAWGEPVGYFGNLPTFQFDASNTAVEQEAQLGMQHDGMHYVPLEGSTRGLLVINHEYATHELLFADGMADWSAAKVRKSQAAHGVSVIEVQRQADGRWAQVLPSRHARRITARTLMMVGGPAAGHPLLRTADDPSGRRVLGTLANCASGLTPWGTVLTCEENFHNYFEGPEQPDAHQQRWKIRAKASYTRWHEHDARFDARRHPNEPNRFGWVVEIDPLDPQSTPIKRTALGRAAHESAAVGLTRDGRAVVYMGDDAAFEYLYKFVSTARMQPGGAKGNARLLDRGTLYVARFGPNGQGQWLPLVHGEGPLTPANGFADAGELLVKTRQAADAVGATPLDRPEWTALDAQGRGYVALTNNARRGMPGQPGTDAVNPRAGNRMGQIVRWTEEADLDSTRFQWQMFILAGDSKSTAENDHGAVRGDAFGSPDGLWVDSRGLLWIQTDMSTSAGAQLAYGTLGNNALLAADPITAEVRRFLVGPRGCEITGATGTPDGTTLFVNVQHPGEGPGGVPPDDPRRHSNWPDFNPQGRPRSATVVIQRLDGGAVGT
jgi:secreted PhoX family phosphatase